MNSEKRMFDEINQYQGNNATGGRFITRLSKIIEYFAIKFNTFFKELNESDETQLKSKISRVCDRFEKERREPLDFFTYNNHYDIVYNDKSIDEEEDDNVESIREETSTTTATTLITTKTETTDTITTDNSISKLSDILLCKIISNFVAFDNDKYERTSRHYKFKNLLFFIPYLIDGENVMNFALISKQLFRVVSKIINNNLFYWNSFIDINNQSEYNLIKSSPLYFDYESIKYIPYDQGIEYANQLLSRVETFVMESDEYDHSINGGVSRSEDIYIDYYVIRFIEEDYRSAIIKDGYLIRPPPMPNLKEIIVLGYHGFEENYSNFLKDLFVSTPNIDGHGIERFTIDMRKDWNSRPDYNNIDFLSSLLNYHSKTLKSILIINESFGMEDLDFLIDFLDEFIPTLKENNIDFKLTTNDPIDRLTQHIDNNSVIRYLSDNTIYNQRCLQKKFCFSMK
ncbi:hypothetical protein PPL_01433 [Heterostelium album PN500]|uniref:Uncharacterized protein n=1 Tax=Heterostelium pallidum (strain ATCC 26659 / Pp 5 / PN500) TaxID=670386 RepID=D3AZ93_HETP5|nr:hypothetical protein PPL_01433 [Heterostelium album PN500]EFA85476.1 hypothetical protein PPL_01433 [Heterostelium album PN500]|eukprot:XP_020437584.1 hypothetical protein PPL_01433 [Heterostelium album PN500]